MFGYGYGSFDEPIRLLADTYWTSYQTVLIDFNGDNHLDIVMLQTDYFIVNILFGDGK
jgi:O-antigen ligase